MNKNIAVITHHIATIMSVVIGTVLLKNQKRKSIALIIFLILQCYALFRIMIAFFAKKAIYEKSYCKLEKIFDSQKTKKYIMIPLIMASTAFKVFVPFWLK